MPHEGRPAWWTPCALPGRLPHVTRVLLDETIETDYGQFDLGWGDGFEGFAGDFDEVFEIGRAHV